MQYPSVLSAPTLMGHFYTLNATWQQPHTTRRLDVVLAATPNQALSGQSQGCSYFDSRRIPLRRRFHLPHYLRRQEDIYGPLTRSQGYLLSAYTIGASGFTKNQPYR